MKIKVIYIISNINKALAFEWTASLIDKDRFDIKFILIGQKNTQLAQFLSINNVSYFEINYQSKKDIIRAFFSTYKHLRKENPQIVHTHLFEANFIGLTVGKLLSIQKRIYTRHHATIHHDYFPMAVWYDKYINWLATDIIALCENLKKILLEKEGVRASKIHLIPHGFKLNIFENISLKRINSVREKHNIPESSPIIGVIARYTIWKGIQYIIPAFRKILLEYPHAHLILANASGDYTKEIKSLLLGIPDNSYTEILFEEDIAALYQLFDLYVHTPIDLYVEAFGQTYVEALAAKIPSVFTLSGIGVDFIKDRKHALVVNHKRADEIYMAIKELLNNPETTNKIKREGNQVVKKRFYVSRMIEALQDLYIR